MRVVNTMFIVHEKSQMFGFVLWHSRLEQKLRYNNTIHQVLPFRVNMEVLLKPVAEEAYAITVKEEVFIRILTFRLSVLYILQSSLLEEIIVFESHSYKIHLINFSFAPGN